MLFSTSSSPAFSWHLQTDTLLFCTSALAMLGMREDTAPATMEALLEHVPPSQRRFLRQQRAVLRSGGRLPGAACAYVCNGRDVNEHMHVLRRDDDDRPQIILACLELLDPPASLPEDVEDGYWSYTRGQAMPFLDMRCMLLLGLGEAPGTLDREGLRRLHGRYRVAGLLSRLRRWLDARDGAERLRLVLMPRRPQGTPLLFTASVLVRDDRGRARAAAGTLAPLLEHKAAAVGGIRRLLLAMTGCRDGLWDWDVWSGQVYYSQSYLAMLGHTAETFPAELGSWLRALHPDDHEKAVALPMKVAASPDAGDAFVCTYRMRHADGSWLWILGRGCVAGRDSEGRALRVVGMHTDVTALQEERDALEGKVQTDPLTGVSSRYHLERVLQRSVRQGRPLYAVMADVDGLKLVNDHLGHEAGDMLLCRAARLLQTHVRKEDCLARIGGDEFVILFFCPGAVVRKRLADIRQALWHRRQDSELPVELSFGVAGSDKGGMDAEELLRRADAAMLRAKKRRRAASHARIRVWLERHTGREVADGDPRL